MKVKLVPDRESYKRMSTEELREAFLITDLFEAGKAQLYYVDVDRAVVGSVVPTNQMLKLETSKELASNFFAERREIGVINIGEPGVVTVDGNKFELQHRDSLYIGRGSKEISFESANASRPAQFYLQSYPAHHPFPTKLIKKEKANQVHLGSEKDANKRTIFQPIRPGIVESCQIVMGFTELAEGCVWNTMPPHTHLRRSEIYLYFDLAENACVFHFMGETSSTRHFVMSNGQAVISPSWSIHCGAGTSRYSFIWGMGGENQEFTDMDGIKMSELR